jgi:glycosyltransferase involved in cell wall biosynthesis
VGAFFYNPLTFMEDRKKKILIHSNFCKAFTGFGKHKKNLLKYLYKTGKYEIVELANAHNTDADILKNLPWKAVGTLPTDHQILKKIQKDQTRLRNAGYGHERIDQIIKDEKPDIYLGVEDIWAFTGFTKKPWWNELGCIIHTTLDSLPLLPESIESAPHIKNYFVWAGFAEKEMKKLGFDHVKTVHGIVEHEHFFKVKEDERKQLRKNAKVTDDFVIGFVFRNQLRKSVPNLLDGFKIFKDRNPNIKAKLLLHTHWGEGWDIKRLIDEKKIDKNSVLTTYFCSACHQYEIKPFEGNGIDCGHCSQPKSCHTTNIKNGVNEKQLNEIYNVMDVYCHPFTSGGQEIPIQEAKLTELITLVTNYSCGEDCCTPDSGGFPLDWTEYREPGTQFIKATTSSKSIADQLEKVYKMPKEERLKQEKKSREFVVNNYSPEVIGGIFEKCFDEMPFVNWDDIDLTKIEKRNPDYTPDENLSNSDWLLALYRNMLKMNINENDQGYKYWMNEFAKNGTRDQIKAYFQKTAKQENKNLFKRTLKEHIDFDRPNKRLAYVMPEHHEDVLMSTSILKSLKQVYPDHDIYFFTKLEYFGLIDECPYIHKYCEFEDEMDDCFYFEGRANHEGYFDLAFLPFLETKRVLNYTHNGKDQLEINLQ